MNGGDFANPTDKAQASPPIRDGRAVREFLPFPEPIVTHAEARVLVRLRCEKALSQPARSPQSVLVVLVGRVRGVQ
jgi:hypothetical protein